MSASGALTIDDVAWGEARCNGCVREPAECLYDGDPYCLDCAELLVERQQAIAINPALRQTLPALFDDR